MLEIFIILILLPIVFVVSRTFSIILEKNDLGPFNTIIYWISFFGVVVHELSHFFISLVVGIRPKSIKIRYRNRKTGQPAPHGAVSLGVRRITFMQALMISLAPLYVSTWLFFFCLSMAINPDLTPLYRILAGVFCVSILLGAAPSSADFRAMGRTFKEHPKYSIYQVLLVSLSALLVLGTLIYYKITLWYDFIYYIFVGIGYCALKYTFKGVGWIIYKMSWNKENYNIKYKAYTRKRFKPAKPRKSGIRKAQW